MEEHLTQGEILRILVKRSGKSNAEIAKALNINTNHLSKIFNSEMLSKKVKQTAIEYFEVDNEYFERASGYSSLSDSGNEVNEPGSDYKKGMYMGDLLKLIKEKERQHSDEMKKLYSLLEKVAKE